MCQRGFELFKKSQLTINASHFTSSKVGQRKMKITKTEKAIMLVFKTWILQNLEPPKLLMNHFCFVVLLELQVTSDL